MNTDKENIIQLEGQQGRLDKVLIDFLPGESRSQIQKYISQELIRVNGQIAKANLQLKGDEMIQYNLLEEPEIEIIGESIPLEIIYEDEDLLIVNKPSGMVVHPSKGHRSGTLVNALIYYLGNQLSQQAGSFRPGIIHRIDKDTSGLLIIAKTNSCHQMISQQIIDRSLVREYMTLVHGYIEAETGMIDVPIGRDPHNRLRFNVQRNGKEAITKFEVIERYQDSTLVKAELLTGRTHQIRVHFEHIGHPVVGDPIYRQNNSQWKGQLLDINDGQLLHAHRLVFVHPRTKERLEFTQALPERFQQILKTLITL